MKQWGRRIRGAIGMGLAWAAAGFGAGFVLARLSSFNPDLPFGLLFGPLGFLSGIIFSVGAGLRGASMWGDFLLFGPALAMGGAVCAAGSLALARRAERRELIGP